MDKDTIYTVDSFAVYKVTNGISTKSSFLILNQGHASILAGCNKIGGDKDGIGEEARFKKPWAITQDKSTGELYVAEMGLKIKKITKEGIEVPLL